MRPYLISLLTCVSLASMSASPLPHPHLPTPWTKDALAGQGWNEYPRPQLERSRWLNLNGRWDYAVTGMAAPAPAKYEGQIRVPYPLESALSGVGRSLEPDQVLWYRRTFTLPADWSGDRILLNFGAVNWKSAVWINGGLAGTHEGGYDPFSIDITAFLKPGQAQEIVISAGNPASAADHPRGKQALKPSGIWYTPSSGIWQTVWLEPVPREASIAEVRAVPDIDTGTLSLSVVAFRPDTPDTYVFRARVKADGRVVAEATHRLDRTVRLTIPRPLLWTPDHPFLYDLDVELFRVPEPAQAKEIFPGAPEEEGLFKVGPEAVAVDAVKSYFGMRQVGMAPGPKGPVFTLNHRPIFMYGTLDQGFWPDGIYTPPTEAAFRHDLDFLKQAGFNMLRKHVKVEPELFYQYCDKIGLLVWQDMPSAMVDTIPPARSHSTSPQFVAWNASELVMPAATAAQFELELRRMIDALRHHPSIVVWVPFNEGWGQYDSARIAAEVKAYDPTRLVDAASGWKDTGHGDIRDIHTYRPKLDMPQTPDAKRSTVIGEFGGMALPIEGHMWSKLGWGYQNSSDAAGLTREYRQRIDGVLAGIRDHGIAAAVYTQTTDVEGELNGLMTYDRAVAKIPAAVLHQINQPLLAHPLP